MAGAGVSGSVGQWLSLAVSKDKMIGGEPVQGSAKIEWHVLTWRFLCQEEENAQQTLSFVRVLPAMMENRLVTSASGAITARARPAETFAGDRGSNERSQLGTSRRRSCLFVDAAPLRTNDGCRSWRGRNGRELDGRRRGALFGVPVALEDAALRVCRAALQVHERIASEAAEINFSTVSNLRCASASIPAPSSRAQLRAVTAPGPQLYSDGRKMPFLLLIEIVRGSFRVRRATLKARYRVPPSRDYRRP
jgi:hypothetical protein